MFQWFNSRWVYLAFLKRVKVDITSLRGVTSLIRFCPIVNYRPQFYSRSPPAACFDFFALIGLDNQLRLTSLSLRVGKVENLTYPNITSEKSRDTVCLKPFRRKTPFSISRIWKNLYFLYEQSFSLDGVSLSQIYVCQTIVLSLQTLHQNGIFYSWSHSSNFLRCFKVLRLI